MAQINTDLETLKTVRDNMKTALASKGQAVDTDIREYVQAIYNIETGGGGSGDVKLFTTVQAMQADSSAQDGDLAIVYRSEIANWQENTESSKLHFPDSVTLPSAITDYIMGYFQPVSGSAMIDVSLDGDASSVSIYVYIDSSSKTISYTSSDGINYTKTSGDSDITLPAEVSCQYGWTTEVGYFVQTGSIIFDGFYKYMTYKDDTEFVTPNYSTVSYDNNTININKTGNNLSKEFIYNLLAKFGILTYKYKSFDITFDGTYYYVIPTLMSNQGRYTVLYYDVTNDKLYHTIRADVIDNTSVPQMENPTIYFKLDNVNNTKEVIRANTLSETIFKSGSGSSTYSWLKINEIPKAASSLWISVNINTYGNATYGTPYFYYGSGIGTSVTAISSYSIGSVVSPTKTQYTIAPCQLDITDNYVFKKDYYGKNGISSGKLDKIILDNFIDNNAEIYTNSQLYYNNLTPIQITDSNVNSFSQNFKCYTIPVKTDGTPLLDVSTLTNGTSLFDGCTELRLVPQLDTSNFTTFEYIFRGCSNLEYVPLLDTSKAIYMDHVFEGCSKIKRIPAFVTTSATVMNGMFYNCTSLEYVPEFNTSKVTNMREMFKNCSNLNNESLNNVLAMCITATSVYGDTKSLYRLGITEAQANVCKTLSNYSAFTAAGWSTGY
jgi:surface protein